VPDDSVLERLLRLRQHQHEGRRSPHKPLLALLALGKLVNEGTSALPWSEAESRLAAVIGEFGPATLTAPAQSAAYPFTRLRSDGVWTLDVDVPMDRVGPLREQPVTGRFAPDVEAQLQRSPGLAFEAARMLVASHFPESLWPDVLGAVGLETEQVLGAPDLVTRGEEVRRRSAAWRTELIEAWDRQCAFCGYDGQIAGAPVGLDAAHVRWFAFDGPDELDNGLALCVLHHKLFDRGVLGLDGDHRVLVSGVFTARTGVGKAVYELAGRQLDPRPGTAVPRPEHVDWHRAEVFKGEPLAV